MYEHQRDRPRKYQRSVEQLIGTVKKTKRPARNTPTAGEISELRDELLRELARREELQALAEDPRKVKEALCGDGENQALWNAIIAGSGSTIVIGSNSVRDRCERSSPHGMYVCVNLSSRCLNAPCQHRASVGSDTSSQGRNG